LSTSTDVVERDLRAFVQRLHREMRLSAVLLFGSRARGDWLESSDVDLLVVSPDFAGVPYLTRLERLFVAWADTSHLAAEVLGLTPDEFARRAQELSIIGEIARDGIVLYSAEGWTRPPVRPLVNSHPTGEGTTS
jgi:predicted nucleotidyltransferase